MDCQLTGFDTLFFIGLVQKMLSQVRRFSFCDHPANNIATKNVNDDVKMKVTPFLRAFEFGDIPRPDLIRFYRY